MNRPNLPVLALGLSALLLLGACKPAPTLEKATKLEGEGQYAAAARVYQEYLKLNPGSPLSPWACLKTARTLEQMGDLEGAIEWYRKVGERHPGSPEEVDALLDLGDLYKGRLKDDASALACYEKALQLYMGRTGIRQAIQVLTDAQYLTATAYFSQKDFKRADQVANAILRTYPSVFLPTDTRAKIESLVDRVGRAEALSRADATMISVREEVAYHKGFESDFPPPFTVDQGTLPSPDRKMLVRVKAGASGLPSLWLGKAPGPNEKTVRMTLVEGSQGASLPSWSPDGTELVYRRETGKLHTLEKADAKTRRTRVLFSTPRNTLGVQPVYHPSGNKIAFVWEGNVWLINADGTNKSMLKVRQRLDAGTRLLFSADGTMIRYQTRGAKGREIEGVLVLDISKFGS